MDKSSHMTLDGARRAARCHELGADLAPAAARNELLNSVNPLLFESPGDVAVNSPQLRRCVSLYLNPRNLFGEGEYSYQCAWQFESKLCSPSSLHSLHSKPFYRRIQHVRPRIATRVQELRRHQEQWCHAKWLSRPRPG